jgi:proteasome accessory factor B
VHGDVVPEGRPGSFEVPEGVDIRSLTERLAPEVRDRRARVLVRRDSAHDLRRHADPVPGDPVSGDPAIDVPEDWDLLEVGYGRTDALADELLGYGEDVVVLEPEELRSAVVQRLRSAAGVDGGER